MPVAVKQSSGYAFKAVELLVALGRQKAAPWASHHADIDYGPYLITQRPCHWHMQEMPFVTERHAHNEVLDCVKMPRWLMSAPNGLVKAEQAISPGVCVVFGTKVQRM